MNLTTEVRALLAWIAVNPGKHGIDMPRKMRSVVRTAEDMDLIVYSDKFGWKLTRIGEYNHE